MTADRAPAGVAHRRAAMAAAAAILAGADLAMKGWAGRALAGSRSIDLGFLQLRLAHNSGIAFGLGAGLPGWVIVGATALLVAGLAIAAWLLARTGRIAVRIGLTLVLAGALANLFDRATDAVVTDYLHTGWWPTFNLADILITGGAAVLLLAGHTHPQPRPPTSHAPTQQPQATPMRRGQALVALIAAWHVIETTVAATAGVMAGSTALIGLGAHSAIGVFAAGTVLWQLRTGKHRPRPARRAIAISYYTLAGYAALASTRNLLTGDQPGPSPIGILLTLIALMMLPPNALAQLRTSHATNTPVLETHATQTWKSTALAVAVLIGLILNTALSWWWADPAAALIIAAIAIQSGREAWHEPSEAIGHRDHHSTANEHGP